MSYKTKVADRQASIDAATCAQIIALGAVVIALLFPDQKLTSIVIGIFIVIVFAVYKLIIRRKMVLAKEAKANDAIKQFSDMNHGESLIILDLDSKVEKLIVDKLKTNYRSDEYEVKFLSEAGKLSLSKPHIETHRSGSIEMI